MGFQDFLYASALPSQALGCLFTIPIATTVAILLIVFFWYVRKTLRRGALLPPGPRPWPVVGNLPELMYNPPPYKWLHSLLTKYSSPIVCVRLGEVHVIVVDNPELASEILKKQDAIFASRPITIGGSYSSKGFLSVTLAPSGDQWKKMRRVLALEILSPARHRWLRVKRKEEADNIVRYILCRCKCEINSFGLINIRNVARHYTANVMRKLVFDRRYFGQGSVNGDGGPGPEEKEHVDACFKVVGLEYNFSVADYLPCLRRLDIGGEERKMKAAIDIVDKYHTPLIEERFRRRRRSASADTEEPKDLLDVLISAKDSDGRPLLSLEEIKAQVADLSYAALDSPSNATEWVLAEMLQQPEIMKKAVEEIDRVVGKDRLVEESDIPELNYVKACAKEALRMHPVAAFSVPHMSIEDATVAGYHIPKGSHVLVSRVGVGRNPKVWEEPLRFWPDRFMNDLPVELRDNELRVLSFGTGRRGCTGVVLGTCMTVILIARLLQGFKWFPPPGGVSVDEASTDLSLATPLQAVAAPRLPHHLYP
uniref:CYP79A120 n=1 Tax=Dacrydium balansae TaxID=120587 RepID=A0A288W895_9CONI|nr:CYP79A120 [Dacrydium balansae]